MKSGRGLKEHSASIGITLRILDAVGIITAGFCSFYWFFDHNYFGGYFYNSVLVGVLMGQVAYSSLGAYQGWRGTNSTTEASLVFWSHVVTFLLIILSAYVTQYGDSLPRMWVFSWFVWSLMFIAIMRISVRRTLGYWRAKGRNIRRILLVGNGDLGLRVIDKLQQNPNLGLSVVGFIDDEPTSSVQNPEYPILGSIDDVEKIVHERGVDQVWITLPLGEVQKMEKTQTLLATTTVTIRIVPDIFGFQLLNHSITEVAGLPLINLSTSPMLEGKNRVLKWLEDKVLASVILLFISPLMLMLAIGVKLSSKGPVFYRQERVSWNSRSFNMLKFRSMEVDSELDGVTWGGAESMKVTRFGRFIRRTSLDELPQFINVLKGDMSIVGPRPERTVFVEQFKYEIPLYMKKHMVKAGITGWAQINGWRGDSDLQQRIDCDLYYIENWSIWLDLKIIVFTLLSGFSHKNAK
ncbi:undecaprenyl-phosphate glucose phosphotransferase [Marinomonas sp. 15G1-11]|uniref:Undecaprenyl-phosphate glucose phosphotransferase n=1 Tax=Marinomonas phaeophyticola TaxID=3004091 RepID=A0ABT4JSG0_9GAMM|nr:undecaprenyl-phosphate glucose phosphotransferase [Marinomonas sp. 15G1-11]MCZ2720977.1 undecaprenyl-phosphate glucose phosphotransferase [Marinomonas sp. 15G1-11]